MIIGLVGYLRFGNFGDELFRIHYSQIFDGHEIIIVNESHTYPYIHDFTKLKKLDRLVIIGGDLINPSWYSELYFNVKYLDLNIPIYIFNVGVASYYDFKDNNKEKYNTFFNNKNVKYISCRDRQSYDWIKNNINLADTSKLNYFSNDVIFGMELNREIKQVNNKTIGVIIRKAQGFNINYEIFASNLIKLYNNGYKINLIVAGTNNTQDDDISEFINLIKLLEGKIEYKLLVPDSTLEIMDLINDCEFIISKKFHICIIALMLNKVVCSFNSEHKFSCLFNKLNLQNMIEMDDPNFYNFFINLKQPNQDIVTNIINATKKNSEFIKELVLKQ
jgi:polysaccharide pyruvyl transferase WcaK-like protein